MVELQCLRANGEGEEYDGMRSEVAVMRSAGPLSRGEKVKSRKNEIPNGPKTENVGLLSDESLAKPLRCPADDAEYADELYRDLCRWVKGERRNGIAKGERAWLIFFGSGFKIGSVILRRL